MLIVFFFFSGIVDVDIESFEWGLVTELDVLLDGLRRDSIPHSPQLCLCLTALQYFMALIGASWRARIL